MRIKFDKKKSEQLRNDPRRKIGFEEAQELFDNVFIEDNISTIRINGVQQVGFGENCIR